ncbi:hypothetical protein N7G274_000768 [Stereocaulon virgatum]|uniref:Uncharacterized protein n=1 Tax=Stereocaulon virgatum TaxID=373712 RepID=A0ABR4AQ93_9LECA
MAQSISPLSPTNANRMAHAPMERKSPYKSPEKQVLREPDTENIPFDNPGGPPSSPFIANPVSSPVRPFTPSKRSSPQKKSLEDYEPRRLTEDALRENEGLTRVVQLVEDHTTATVYHTLNDDTMSSIAGPAGDAGMDDTAFSAFSAVPNVDMTRFAQVGQPPTKNGYGSPTKSQRDGAPTPRPTGRNTPSRNTYENDDSYSSPTPRRPNSSRYNDTTNLLVDFTGDFTSMARHGDRSPTRNGRQSPNKHQSDLLSYASSRRTPSPAKHPLPPSTPSESRHLANLLDFDLSPAPTPRSMPSISARELESMKSAFQSQISSLTATLKGKDAEVSSLKGAVEDAERRVGEALEEIRNERGAKESLQNEKLDWEKREQEMKDVLRSVKEEIVRNDREKDHLLQRVTEAEYKREEAETKVLEAESKMAGIKAGSSSTVQSENGSSTSSEVEAAVTKVAKELHGLYKSKHETKVTALKKSYSDRWEKKVRDLQAKIDEMSKENEDLRIGRDATMTGVDPGNWLPSAESEEQGKEREAEKQRFQEQRIKLENVERELSSLHSELNKSKETNASLISELEASRLETADLIAATEELMSLSQTAMSNSGNEAQQASTETRSTLSRSSSGSGLKAPSFGTYSGESRIGRMAPTYGSGYRRERSGSGTGAGGRSGLLGNIERMGRGRAID